MIRIVSYGTLHQDPPPGDALLVDLTTALRNPHQNPAMRYLTGRDEAVREHVLTTPGAADVIAGIVMRAELVLAYHRAARTCTRTSSSPSDRTTGARSPHLEGPGSVTSTGRTLDQAA